jgi:hypothetical protein
MTVALSARDGALASGFRIAVGLVQSSFEFEVDSPADSYQLMVIESLQTFQKSVHAGASWRAEQSAMNCVLVVISNYRDS